jgi:inorganic pyrophosphatase/exopolyphosphatase
MIKHKTIKPFKFKDMSNINMVNILDNKLPINLKYNEDLVNRVYSRYSVLEKSQIAFLIKAIFKSMRHLLVMCKTLNFFNVFFNARIIFYKKTSDIKYSCKIKATTPPKLRVYDE